jgi:hypothetical protein
MLIEQSKFARPKENAPQEAGHYLSLVARGGINQGLKCLIPASNKFLRIELS